jgi:predicted deacylase
MINRRHVAVSEDCTLELCRASGASNGPRVSVLGGVHGDERVGVLAAWLLLAHLEQLGADRLRGTVEVVPVANPPAFRARRRTNPIDGANLARLFPGNERGTTSERLAYVITKELISGADLLVDLHSAGTDYAMPLFAGYVAHPATDSLAAGACRAFAAPLTWEHVGSNPGRSLAAARGLEVASIYVEGSGGPGLDRAEVDAYFGGLVRVLEQLGMLEATSAPAPAPEPVILRGGDGNTDALARCESSGLCVTQARPGDIVTAGEVIAEVIDERGALAERIRADRSGTVMMLRRAADVVAGDGIVMLGPAPGDL